MSGPGNGTTPPYVLRAEWEQSRDEQQEEIDTLVVGGSVLRAGLARIEANQGLQSNALADIAAGLVRIENRLSTHDRVIEGLDSRVDDVDLRASKPDETMQEAAKIALDLSRLEVERSRESIAARRDNRAARIEAIKRWTLYLTSGGGLMAILYLLAKMLGVIPP